MKQFLHFSCSLVCGINCAAIWQAYGWQAWCIAFVAGIYVMVAQWIEGREYS